MPQHAIAQVSVPYEVCFAWQVFQECGLPNQIVHLNGEFLAIAFTPDPQNPKFMVQHTARTMAEAARIVFTLKQTGRIR